MQNLAIKIPVEPYIKNNIATVINQDNNQVLSDRDYRLEKLQTKLLKLARTKSDYDEVGDEIYHLRDKKQNI